MNIKSVRDDFPILKRKMNGKPLIYLDNAATSQKPQQVIDAVSEYYSNYNANVHRGIHKLSEEATIAYESAHEKTARFIGAHSMKEIIFTRNTTESLNVLARALAKSAKGKTVLLTRMEHHSNLVPWQQLAKSAGCQLDFLELGDDGSLDIDESKISRAAIVSFAHVSNVLGTVNDARTLCRLAKKHGALSIVDAAQSAPFMEIDVRELGCDFLAFSSHKALGPTGIGVLYGREALLEKLDPVLFGGDMIKTVSFSSAEWNDLPWKFEAGTPDIAGAIGFGTAIDYLKNLGMKNVEKHERSLAACALGLLSSVSGTDIYGPKERGPLVSFNLKGVHAHDVAEMLSAEGIAIRGGHHCAQPLMDLLNINGSARMSFSVYNTESEVQAAVNAIKKVKKVFG